MNEINILSDPTSLDLTQSSNYSKNQICLILFICSLALIIAILVLSFFLASFKNITTLFRYFAIPAICILVLVLIALFLAYNYLSCLKDLNNSKTVQLANQNFTNIMNYINGQIEYLKNYQSNTVVYENPGENIDIFSKYNQQTNSLNSTILSCITNITQWTKRFFERSVTVDKLISDCAYITNKSQFVLDYVNEQHTQLQKTYNLLVNQYAQIDDYYIQYQKTKQKIDIFLSQSFLGRFSSSQLFSLSDSLDKYTKIASLILQAFLRQKSNYFITNTLPYIPSTQLVISCSDLMSTYVTSLDTYHCIISSIKTIITNEDIVNQINSKLINVFSYTNTLYMSNKDTFTKYLLMEEVIYPIDKLTIKRNNSGAIIYLNDPTQEQPENFYVAFNFIDALLTIAVHNNIVAKQFFISSDVMIEFPNKLIELNHEPTPIVNQYNFNSNSITLYSNNVFDINDFNQYLSIDALSVVDRLYYFGFTCSGTNINFNLNIQGCFIDIQSQLPNRLFNFMILILYQSTCICFLLNDMGYEVFWLNKKLSALQIIEQHLFIKV